MKRPLSIFALLALSATVLQAAPMYTIHLSNSERFTECTVIYRSDTSTKFRGKNRDGKMVTKEIPSSSILAMREIEVKTPAAEQPAPAADKPAEQPQSDAAQPTEPEKKEGEQPAAEADKQAEGDAAGDAPPPRLPPLLSLRMPI